MWWLPWSPDETYHWWQQAAATSGLQVSSEVLESLDSPAAASHEASTFSKLTVVFQKEGGHGPSRVWVTGTPPLSACLPTAGHRTGLGGVTDARLERALREQFCQRLPVWGGNLTVVISGSDSSAFATGIEAGWPAEARMHKMNKCHPT